MKGDLDLDLDCEWDRIVGYWEDEFGELLKWGFCLGHQGELV